MDDIVVIDGWRSRLEAAAGDRKRLVTWAAAVGGILVIFLLLGKASRPEPVIAAPATSATPGAAVAERSLFVHVAGAVARPGLYRFPDGLRVADAIEAAGGPLRRADLDAINLADLLADGLKIDVPFRGDPVTAAVPTASATPAAIDLNTADQASLETIPGVGPVTATAILQHRTEIGSFESVDQLLDVTGIGPATLEALRPYVSV